MPASSISRARSTMTRSRPPASRAAARTASACSARASSRPSWLQGRRRVQGRARGGREGRRLDRADRAQEPGRARRRQEGQGPREARLADKAGQGAAKALRQAASAATDIGGAAMAICGLYRRRSFIPGNSNRMASAAEQLASSIIAREFPEGDRAQEKAVVHDRRADPVPAAVVRSGAGHRSGRR